MSGKKHPISTDNQSTPRSLFTKAACILIILSFLTVSTPAAPETLVTAYNTVGEIKEDIQHKLKTRGFGASFFSMAALRTWLASLKSSKRLVLDRIDIQPSDEDGSLTIMQGERVVLSAIGYTNDEAVNGIAFRWTIQDAAVGYRGIYTPIWHDTALARAKKYCDSLIFV